MEKEILVAAPEGAKLPERGSTITVHCTGYGKDRDLTKSFGPQRIKVNSLLPSL